MNFDWSDYLNYSESVSQKNSVIESEIRSAISRVYYSVHNTAAESIFKTNKVKKQHSDLITHYKSDKSNVSNQEAGKILSGLRFDRINSDYYSDTSKLGSNLGKKLESVILQAKEFKRLTGL